MTNENTPQTERPYLNRTLEEAIKGRMERKEDSLRTYREMEESELIEMIISLIEKQKYLLQRDPKNYENKVTFNPTGFSKEILN